MLLMHQQKHNLNFKSHLDIQETQRSCIFSSAIVQLSSTLLCSQSADFSNAYEKGLRRFTQNLIMGQRIK